MKTFIIIPVYNERGTMLEILRRVLSVDIEKEIIVVDDGSIDGTAQILKNVESNNIKIIYHPINKGKGAAIRTGIGCIPEDYDSADKDIVIFQDADLEYDPNEYKTLTKPIIDGCADVVYGSRLIGGCPHRAYLFWHLLGNNLLTLITNVLYNTTLSDMETGYKVFRKKVIKNLKLRSNGFSIEAEVTAKIFKKKLIVYEIPISYFGRSYKEGKKITWRQGVSAIFALLWYRFFD